MKNKYFSLKADFENITDHNSTILVAKMKVFAFGKNLNLSSISQSAFESEKTRNSIYNIPVVAKFNDGEDVYGQDGDLEGHNTKLSTDKNGNLTIIADTFPIGVIGSDANITYEQVNEGTEEYPDMKTYVCVDKVYLWKRYDAVQKIQEWMSEGVSPKVSMEIGNIVGHYSKEQNAYVIESFEFEAVAALGSSILPCFPMAQIESYSSQTFEEAYYSMLKELKNSLQPTVSEVAEVLQEGGNKIVPEEILALLEKYSLTETDLIEKEIQYAEYSLDELEVKINDTFQKEEVAVETEPTSQFSLTSEQMESELRRELAGIETLTEVWYDEVYTSPRYYYRDHKPEEKIVVALDEKNWYLIGASYSVIGDAVEIDASTITRFKLDYSPMDLSGDPDSQVDGASIPEDDDDDMFSAFTSKAKADFMVQAKENSLRKQFEIEKEAVTSELASQLTELQEKYSALEGKLLSVDAELAAKVQAEREASEEVIFQSFAKSLTEDEMADIKAKKAEFSLQEIEEKLCVILGKKTINASASATFSATKVEEEVKPLRYSIVNETVKTVSDKSYADLIKVKE